MTTEEKIELIRKAIRTEEGWKALANAVNNAPDRKKAEEKTVKFLQKIGGDRTITLKIPSKAASCSSRFGLNEEDEVDVGIGDLLVNELKKHMAILMATCGVEKVFEE